MCRGVCVFVEGCGGAHKATDRVEHTKQAHRLYTLFNTSNSLMECCWSATCSLYASKTASWDRLACQKCARATAFCKAMRRCSNCSRGSDSNPTAHQLSSGFVKTFQFFQIPELSCKH